MSRLFNRFKQDVVGILFAGIGIFLVASLFSYNPKDPSFNAIGATLKAANWCGLVGSFVADAILQIFGIAGWLLAIGSLRLSFISFSGESVNLKNVRMIWASLLILTACGLLATYFPEQKVFSEHIYLSGLMGIGLQRALVAAVNPVGAQILLWSLTAVLAVFYSEKTISQLFGYLLALPRAIPLKKLVNTHKNKAKKSLIQDVKDDEKHDEGIGKLASKIFPVINQKPGLDSSEPPEHEQIIPTAETEDAAAPARRKVTMKAKVARRIENWELPKISLLEDPPASRVKIDEKEVRRKAEVLTDKLSQFSVTGEVVAAKPGPAVTMFEFKPSANVRVSKITELEDDLSLALSSESLRIIAPIPGRDVVGIETSNIQRETVYGKDLLADEAFWKDEIKLPVALGKQANGDPRIVDLRKMPHLMVAGTTGSGKSVFIVSAITGLLFKHSPKTLRLILIDPKQVDLAAFSDVPHLIMPTVTETRQAVSALKWAVREMEKRYKSMNRFGARGLEAFNDAVAALKKEQIEEHEKANHELENTPGKKNEQYYFQPLPYIVIVVEEFGDLMTVDKANVETAVVRLAQMARACGIHLILAMQSPRKEVVTGLIKTNIPGRISFKVNSSMDSRIILDETGAERLLAQGDMLYKSPGGSSLIRHHAPFIKDVDINAVAKFWSEQAEPEYDPTALKAVEAGGAEATDEAAGADGGGADDYDDRYDEILAWASAQKEVSASLIQRRFSLGYPRAARIVECMEREGVVGPAVGSKPRQVLINSYDNPKV